MSSTSRRSMSPISGETQAFSSPGSLLSWCRSRLSAGPLTGVGPVEARYGFMHRAQGIISLTVPISAAKRQSVRKVHRATAQSLDKEKSNLHTKFIFLGRVRLADLQRHALRGVPRFRSGIFLDRPLATRSSTHYRGRVAAAMVSPQLNKTHGALHLPMTRRPKVSGPAAQVCPTMPILWARVTGPGH